MAKVKPDARLLAVQLMQQVLEGRSLSSALPIAAQQLSSVKDKAFMQMLVYGCCRWYPRLEFILSQLLQKKLKDKDQDIKQLLLLALFQLMDTRVPDYASVSASVELTRSLKKKWAAGLVNAVLRNFIRQKETLLEAAEKNEKAATAHPKWILRRLKKDWPEASEKDWRAITEANNQQAPMTLRINQQKISTQEYVAQLADADAKVVAQRIELSSPREVLELPGYEDGWFSVQDAAAQLAAPLLDVQQGQRVLDCCAAPGGKTAHILELQPSVNMLALDISEKRLMRVEENLQRLGLQAELMPTDAAMPEEWWDEHAFDRILLDAPCSASGVIRRHPDIKLLRREDDILALNELQQQMLSKIWPLLKTGGKLLYATCSVFKAENEQQIKSFLAQQSDAKEIVIDAEWGEARAHGRQIFPGENNMDGFYYALLQKIPAADV